MWWSHSVRLTIKYPSGNGNPRDYLVLERTYLAYIRTSSAIVSLGVVIVQLFILKNVSKTTGVVLGATLSGGGIIVAMVGCFRFFRQQEHMNKGKTICAGLDMLAVWAIMVLISLTLFIVVLVEDWKLPWSFELSIWLLVSNEDVVFCHLSAECYQAVCNSVTPSFKWSCPCSHDQEQWQSSSLSPSLLPRHANYLKPFQEFLD